MQQNSVESSLGLVTKTERGSIITNNFCMGVHLGGTYTVAEIFETAVKHKPKEIDEYHPPVSNWSLYNEFVWTPWNRFSHKSGERITRRCKMHTAPTQSDEVVTDYIGTGDHVEHSWPRYITTADRIGALLRFSDSLSGLRVLDLGCACGNNLLGLAAYGMEVFGIESHPEMFNKRHTLLRDRIMFGDALECLYGISKNSLDVVIVSMLGNVWWNDVRVFLDDAASLLHPGGVLVLDLFQHKHAQLKAKNLYKLVLKEIDVPAKLSADNMLLGVKMRP